MNISKYISYIEATKSDTAIRKGIENIPNPEQLANMKYVATEIFDKVRDFVGGRLHVNSFFRSEQLNSAIGGAKQSEHMKGQAIDIDCDQFGNGSNKQIFYFVKDKLEFNQLIWEFGSKDQPDWIHVSKSKGHNRKEVLRAYKTEEGDTRYVPFDL